MKLLAPALLVVLFLAVTACGGNEALPSAPATGTATQGIAIVTVAPSPVPTPAQLALPAATPLPVISTPVTTLAPAPAASPTPGQPPAVVVASPVVPAKPVTGNLSERLQRLADLAAAGTLAPTVQGQSQQVGLAASGPGSLSRNGTAVVVEARLASTSASQLDAIRAAGGRVLSVYEPQLTATLAIEPARLRAVAAVPGVVHVDEVLQPATN